jgi:hypothetical protein
VRCRQTDVLRFLKPPLLAGLATVLLIVIVYLEQHTDVGILAPVFMISCLIYAGVAVFFIGNFCINILKRKLVPSARMLLAFSVMIVSAMQAQELTAKAFQGIDVVRFCFSQNYYLRIIERQRDQTQRFPWGSGGFLGTNFFYTLIYHPHSSSDPPTPVKRSDCTETMKKIREDFYIESEVCQ